jgi:acetylornithine deacetylase/succinyl-diaminopimelate desuccinylase-like protein
MNLDEKIRELATRYRPLATEILKEAIRIPHDYVDASPDEGGDPLCGLSNHEGPRLRYLQSALVEHACVAKEEDTWFDDYGNLVWVAQDESDGVAAADKVVVYMDGHTDTVKALRSQWTSKIGEGLDAYQGMTDPERVDRAFLRRELGYVPPNDEWDNLVFGRGSADQLGGVVCQMISTKILLELRGEGALRGAIVRSYATAAEEDNDGGGPMHVMQKVLPGAGPELIPDCVILSEGTGDSTKGAVGIYRGQRGRMQIVVQVTGRSCHGSMPWEGLNPLEFGAAILVEAAAQYDAREGFKDDAFLGHGTRTASWSQLETPSDCAVPDRFTFRLDRRLTAGEDPEEARAAVENLPAVGRAREAGLQVEVVIPTYSEDTWKGYRQTNPQIYPGWVTPEAHEVIQTAVDAYARVITPQVSDAEHARQQDGSVPGSRRQDCRVDRWIFSTDGVGFPVPKEGSGVEVPASKDWVDHGTYHHPPMFGCGPGQEQNTHKIGECVDTRELESVIAFMARFPSLLAERKG